MRRIISAVALVSAIAAASAVQAQTPPSGVYAMDPTHARLTWRIEHMGLSNYVAWFDSFDATVTLDADDPTNSSVTATVDPTSVNTGNSGFDTEIAQQFLSAGEFPEATFVSTGVEMTGDTTAVITGVLTLAGVEQEVVFDAELTGFLESHPFVGAPAMSMRAVAEIDRTAFDVTAVVQDPGIGAPIASPIVQLEIEAEFILQQ